MHLCMNWKAIAFDWNQVRAFLVTAEEGSLSAAARELGLTQPTLGRQVSALENELGVTLFERVGKSLKLTQSGLELLEHVREMGAAATKISLTASGQSQDVSGKVSITASDVMSAEHLPEFLIELREAAPLISVDIVADNQISDLLRRDADIAIRHVRPEQPDLIARLVTEETAHFYAVPDYLNTNGTPRSIEELKKHFFVGFADNQRMIEILGSMGINVNENQFLYGSKNGVTAWQMTLAGLGICIMSDKVAQKYPKVIRLELGMEPIVFPIWLATHRELHTSRRIRLVFDLLADFLKSK